MKRIIALVMTLSLLLCGCGKAENKGIASYPLDESRAKMGATLYDYTAAINGKVVAFPLKYSDFAATGFALGSSLKNAVLSAGQYSIYKVSSGEITTEAYIANFEESEKKLTECTVCGVVVNAEQGVSLELPQGITFGVDANKVKEKYGAADSEAKDKEFDKILKYGSELEGAELKFKNEKLHEVYYFKVVDPEYLAASSEAPNEVKGYSDPAELSSNLKDFTFYLYGTTYTMPLPVSRLIEAGWIKVAESHEYIPAGETVEGAVKLTAANRTLTLGVKNVADYPTTVKNCYVTEIKSTTDVKLDMTLAGGCRVGTTATNLESVFGKENFTEIEKRDGNTYYTYIHEGEAKLTVIASNKSGYITEIKFELL